MLQSRAHRVDNHPVNPMHESASGADASILRHGSDPIRAGGTLARVLIAISTRINGVRCTEVLNYAGCDQPMALFDVVGFGRALDDVPAVMQPGVLTQAWGGAVRALASGVGIQIDSMEEHLERVPAGESFDVRAGTIAAGTVAALRFRLRGIHGGDSPIVFEHVARLRPEIAPEWPQPGAPGCYQVRVSGDPSYTLDLPFAGGPGHGSEVLKTTALRLVCAIPDALAVPPGLLTALQLPPVLDRTVGAPTVR